MFYLILIFVFKIFFNQRPEEFEQEYLNKIITKLNGALLTKIDMQFINGMIRKYKPKKILEIGVASGGSSAIILNAIQNIENSHLYSIDKLTYVYNRKEKGIGWIVKENFSNFMKKWTLFTGGITANFIEQIGGNIDLVFIDTVHYSPGEWLDIIQVIPFMKKKNAILILHDINYQFSVKKVFYSSNDHLFTYLKGTKIIPKVPEIIPNIGAVILENEQNKFYFDYFFALTSTWDYIPSNNEWNIIRKFIVKYYEKELIDIYDRAYIMNENYKKKMKEIKNETTEINKKKEL